MEIHPYAEMLPLGNTSGPEWDAFVASIEVAQYDPIVIWNGKLLDGRRRSMACEQLGRRPQAIHVDFNDRTALDYVLAHNLHRRHLNETQRALVGSRYADNLANLAKKRQTDAGKEGKKGGRGKKKTLPMNSSEGFSESAPKDASRSRETREVAAAVVNVGPQAIDFANKVRKEGVPELEKMCDRGEVSVSAAAEVAKLPEPEQQEIVRQGADAVKAQASQKRKAKKTKGKKAPAPASMSEDQLLMALSKEIVGRWCRQLLGSAEEMPLSDEVKVVRVYPQTGD